MFAFALSCGVPLEAARTITVNTIVVMEIFYLFNVHNIHGTWLSFANLRSTPAVLAGVVLLQLVFPNAPFMAIPFGSAPRRIRRQHPDPRSRDSAVCRRRDGQGGKTRLA